nr:unnamed protein product [Spirometra erinaceieuropaei]
MKALSVRLSHCTADGCLVKSPSRDLLIDHVRRSHCRETTISFKTFIRETVEFACAFNGSVPSFLRCFTSKSDASTAQSHSQESSLPYMSPSSYALPESDAAAGKLHIPPPARPLCLRCPICGFTTLHWDYFSRHAASCLRSALPPTQPSKTEDSAGAVVPESNPCLYTCSLYWCSVCSTVSTERSLVVEHIEFAHTDSSFACAFNGSVPSFLRCFTSKSDASTAQSHSQESSLPYMSPSSYALPGSDAAAGKLRIPPPARPLCLRCPICGFTTLHWDYFSRHAASCLRSALPPTQPSKAEDSTGAVVPESNPCLYTCSLYWCSVCSTVSTERSLVVEHIEFAHTDSSAVVVSETFELTDSNLDAVMTTLDNKSVLRKTQTGATAPGLPNPLSQLSAADVFSAFSKLLPPSAPGQVTSGSPFVASPPFSSSAVAVSPSTTPSSSSSKNIGMNSALNSVRSSADGVLTCPPSTSKSPATTAAATAVDPPHRSSSPVFTPSDTAGGLFTPNGPLANPFLTNFSDPSGFFSPEAASAMAAMAAAALSGLTGLNVGALPSAEASTAKGARSSMQATPVSCDTNATTDKSKHSSEYPPVEPPSLPLSNGISDTVDYTGRDDSTTVAEDGLSLIRAGSGSNGEELVSFPFDEVAFRNEMTGRLSPEILDSLIEKMQRFSGCLVRIVGKENHRRIPACPECDRVFSYGLADFKRHLLSTHLEVPREYLKDLLRYTRLPKGGEKFVEAQEQLAMRQMKPHFIEPGKRRIPLPYSFNILRRLTEHLSPSSRTYLFQKMRLYSRLGVVMETKGGIKKYKCYHCAYSSPHALADVRKHILGSHCGISTKHFRFCLQASRLDPVEFSLLSDDRLARLARDFMTRRQTTSSAERVSSSNSSVGGDCGVGTPSNAQSRSPSPVTGLNKFARACKSTAAAKATAFNGSGNSGLVKGEKSPSSTMDENGVSRFTTVIPGSKNPVTVCIRPPIPPGNSGGSPPAVTATNVPHSPSFGTDGAPPTQVSSPLSLENIPKVAGLQGADQVVSLPLPFSESVLRQLLESAGAQADHVNDVCRKMRVYSTYVMTRICVNDRTLAFRCPCGRIFVTTRQPESKMRAATLADSRRHVMGVHARIPHEFITICCQASRISRENNFQLYPDEMLLRLAMDRPIRLNASPSGGAARGVSAFRSGTGTTSMASGAAGRSSYRSSLGRSYSGVLPPLRPLADLGADRGTEPDEPIDGSPTETGGFLFQDEEMSDHKRLSGVDGKRTSSAHDNGLLSRRFYRPPFRHSYPSLSRIGAFKMRTNASSISTPARPKRSSKRPHDAVSPSSKDAAFSSIQGSSLIEQQQGEGPVDDAGEDTHPRPINTEETLRYLNERPPNEVERVIELPYSKSALKALVRGYCPNTYFDVLVNKMELYTAYRVYVTRNRGRRFFCCSGCPSSSPHGMGDIRKHILGVHAKVPERYKAAAMHCSRLSREDNTLLPDRSLLQLARMRWKGTVIKPLAEISASETTTLQQPQPLQHSGNRRASASAFSPTTKSPSCGSGSGHHQLDAVGNNDCDAGLPLHTGSRQNGGGGVDAYCPPRILSRVLPSGGLEFVCPVCDLCCEQSPAALRVHFARAHLDLDAYVCPHCRSSTFSDLHAIRTHLQDEHPESAWCSTEDLLSETFRAAVAGVVIEESSAEAIRQPKSPKYVSSEDLELGRYCCESPPPPPASSSGGEVQSLRDREEASSSCRSSGLVENACSPVVSKSGSSRRKPSKSHLIQFKPKEEGPVFAQGLEMHEAKRPRLSPTSHEDEELEAPGDERSAATATAPLSLLSCTDEDMSELAFGSDCEESRIVKKMVPCD